MHSEDLAVEDEERSSNVKHFNGIGHHDPIEIHDATTNVPSRGTAIEIRHDSDHHIFAACVESGANCEQPVELWLL
jgi:hypothetical protein